MKSTIATKRETTTESYGGHRCEVSHLWTIQHHTFAGRTYQSEQKYRDGICTFSAEYPAGTEYAERRLAACRA